jgi:hypothetical protein
MQNNHVLRHPDHSPASKFLAHLKLQLTGNWAMGPVQTIVRTKECSLYRSGVTTRSIHSPASLSLKLLFSPHRFSHVHKETERQSVSCDNASSPLSFHCQRHHTLFMQRTTPPPTDSAAYKSNPTRRDDLKRAIHSLPGIR